MILIFSADQLSSISYVQIVVFIFLSKHSKKKSKGIQIPTFENLAGPTNQPTRYLLVLVNSLLKQASKCCVLLSLQIVFVGPSGAKGKIRPRNPNQARPSTQ